MTELQERLRAEFIDAEYRHGYASEFLDIILARQIRTLRKQRGWTQAVLADMISSKQPFISAIEDEEYGALSLSKLKDLARVFDVYLDVRFRSFRELVADVERTSVADLAIKPFGEDSFFQTVEAVATVSMPPKRVSSPSVRGAQQLITATTVVQPLINDIQPLNLIFESEELAA